MASSLIIGKTSRGTSAFWNRCLGQRIAIKTGNEACRATWAFAEEGLEEFAYENCPLAIGQSDDFSILHRRPHAGSCRVEPLGPGARRWRRLRGGSLYQARAAVVSSKRTLSISSPS
jgi:hypothetical protein